MKRPSTLALFSFTLGPFLSSFPEHTHTTATPAHPSPRGLGGGGPNSFESVEPSLLLVLLQFREAISSGVSSAGGSLGPPHLRWPPGCREMRRTKLPSPAKGVAVKSLSFRVRFLMKLPRQRHHLGIRSFRAFPRLADALLRCQRRVRGGGVRLCRLVYRSLCGLWFRRFEGGGASGALYQGYSDSCGSCGWLESGPSSIFPWRESTVSFDLWSEGLGACPRPMFFHRRLHSGLDVGCLMRLSQSFFTIGLL
jgi:hypothetical protein